MSGIHFPGGIGGSTGDRLATNPLLYLSGPVLYVSSVSGNDSYSGLTRDYPLATLTAALTAAADNATIVLLDNHAEDIGLLSITEANLAILGEGIVDGKPGAVLTQTAGASGLVVSGDNFVMGNVRMQAPSSASVSAQVTLSGDNALVRGCRFEQNENSDATGVRLSSGIARAILEDCVFASTAETPGATPRSAVQSTGNVTGLRMTRCTFDAGAVNWDSAGDASSNPWALDLDVGLHTAFLIEDLSLLSGAVARISDVSTGRLTLGTLSGGARVEW